MPRFDRKANMSKIKYIVGSAALDKAILGFAKKSLSLQTQMHVIACSVLNHAAMCGDVRPMAKFLHAMPASGRTNALIKWFAEAGGVAFDGKVPLAANKAKQADIKARQEAAEATPFWEFTPDVDYKAVDLVKLITDTIKKLEKDQEKTEKDHSGFISVLKGQLAARNATTNLPN